MHLIYQLEKPVIFAHRGYSTKAPENTIAAFDLAFQAGAHGIEIDVRLTNDGIPVVIHDRSVKRTTTTSGLIDRLTLHQIKSMDAGSWFSSKFSGERIPTLEQVLERYGKKHLINVELKSVEKSWKKH